eukprot:1481482-Pleurochrysis_carterae.AAC.2
MGQKRCSPFDQTARRSAVEAGCCEAREVRRAERPGQLTVAGGAVLTAHLLHRERHQGRHPRLHHCLSRLQRHECSYRRLVRADGRCLQWLARVLPLPRAPFAHVLDEHQHRGLVVLVAARRRQVEEQLARRVVDEVRLPHSNAVVRCLLSLASCTRVLYVCRNSSTHPICSSVGCPVTQASSTRAPSAP